MRILLLSQYFWPENFRINDVARGLRERGHQVCVITGMPNYPGGRLFKGYGSSGPYGEFFEGIEVRRAPLVPRGNSTPLRLMLNYISLVISLSLLAPWIARGRFDVLLVYEPSPITIGIPARIIKWLKRLPIVFWVQDLWPQSLSATGAIHAPRLLASVDRMVRWIYRGCDRVLVQSRAFIAPIVAQGVAPQSIVYLPNSAEAYYRRIEPRVDDAATLELRPGFRIVFAGNIGAAQDFPTIVAAAELLRQHLNIQWIVIGEGRMQAWVEAEVRKLGLESTFQLLGSRPAQQMPVYFAHADILLATLRRDPIFAYTVPAKIQSYMACGKAMIAALEGEGAKLVRDAGAGWVVPPENPQALAETVLAASRTDKSQLEIMGSQGQKYFNEQFERSILLERLETVLLDVAGVAA